MNASTGQVVIDVTMSVKVEKGGASTATVERVKDGLGKDITAEFTNFAAQEGLDLATQGRIEAAAEKFAKKHESRLP
jgi:hypothetical protein